MAAWTANGPRRPVPTYNSLARWRMRRAGGDDGTGYGAGADSTGDGSARGPRAARGHPDRRRRASEGFLLPGIRVPGAAAPGVQVGRLLAGDSRHLSPDPHHPVGDAATGAGRADQPARAPHVFRG